MSLLEAMQAVRQGMALSTQLTGRAGAGSQQAVPTETPPAGAPPESESDGGGGWGDVVGSVLGLRPPRYTQTNADGSKTVYELKGGAPVVVGTIPAPVGQTDAPLLPYGAETWPVPMAAANELLAGAGYPAGAGLDDAGGALDDVYTRTLFGRKDSPEYAAGVDAARQRYIAGAADARDVNVLLAANEISIADARKSLNGIGAGGGGYSAAQAADDARQARQDEWDRVLDYITAARQERDLTAALAQQRRQNLMAAAPDLAGGMEFRGGFGPTGGYTTLSRLQRGIGAPKSMGPSLVPLDLGPVPVESDMVARLLGPIR